MFHSAGSVFSGKAAIASIHRLRIFTDFVNNFAVVFFQKKTN